MSKSWTSLDLASPALPSVSAAPDVPAPDVPGVSGTALPGGSGPAGCCPPLSQQPLSAEQADQIAPLLKALADPVRLRLMSLVASHPGGEACVCYLTGAFELSQPTISHHLKVLHACGLLDREKRGVWVYYKARTEALASLGTLIGAPAGRADCPIEPARIG